MQELPGPSIRGATPADLARILELVESAGLPANQLGEFLPGFLVAENGGRLVACGGIEIYGQAAVLRSFVVEPEQRGAGLGRRIFERQVEAARCAGVQDVYLFTLDARDFWQRMGFQEIPLSLWPAAASHCWQYQLVAARRKAFERVGVISMWRPLDGSVLQPLTDSSKW